MALAIILVVALAFALMFSALWTSICFLVGIFDREKPPRKAAKQLTPAL